MENSLLPTAPIDIEKKIPPAEDFPLSKSMKEILIKSNRLTHGGREKLVRLIQNDTPMHQMSMAFQVTDTILRSEGIHYSRGKVTPNHLRSPLNIRERRTQFYVKKHFESYLNPKQFNAKMERGTRLANQMKELKLKRLIATNKAIHKHSLDNQEKIWSSSLIERAFANRQSEKDLVNAVRYKRDNGHRSRSGRHSDQNNSSKLPSTHRSISAQDQMASLLERLDIAKQKIGDNLETLGQKKLTTASKELIDNE